MRSFEKDKRFLIPLYLVILFDYVWWLYLLFSVSTGRIGTTLLSFINYFVSGGILGSVNSVVGHELFHKRSTFHKFLGALPYFKYMATQIHIFHVNYHHKLNGIPNLDDNQKDCMFYQSEMILRR